VTQGPPPPPSAAGGGALGLVLVGIVCALALAAGSAGLARRRSALWPWAGVVCNLVALALLAWVAGQLDDPRAHARDALRAAMAGYVGVHILVATAMAAFTADQFRRGEIADATGRGAIPAWANWQMFTAVTTGITVAVFVVQAGVT